MQSFRLKIKIILALAIFIAIGMLLIDVVISMTNHKRLLVAEVEQAEVVAAVFADRLGQAEEMAPSLLAELASHAKRLGMALLVADAQGRVCFQSHDQQHYQDELRRLAQQAMRNHTLQKTTASPLFGLLGRRYGALLLATPVRTSAGQISGGLALVVDLTPLHKKFWDDQGLFMLYVVFNLVVLTFMAYQRMVKLLMKPLQRLVKRAEEYQDDESFYFVSDRKGDDVAALSSSLNRMLRRINTDRHKLQDMVRALEEANRSLKRAQQEVIRAEKLASVGRLSAGIAHEIGNPVGIVLGYLELLKQDSLAPADRLDFIGRAIDEINRINTIIRQLLDLARCDIQEHGEVHVHELLSDLCAGLQEQPLLAEMHVSLEFTAADDRVQAIADRLRQVFLNIIMNAADAVKDNDAQQPGELTISTAIAPDQLVSGRPSLEISFADNGPGINVQDVESVFDPFFTTKEPGKGTGLGLSVSYMIIENVGGKIRATSRPEGGSVFTVLLPLAGGDNVPRSQSQP